MDPDLPPLPDDLRPIAARLVAERPRATARQLDAVQRRIALGHRRPEGPTMKTRLAMITMLVLGMLTATTGAGLAVSGLGTSGSAAQLQYGKAETPTTQRPTAVLGEQAENTPTRDTAPGKDQDTPVVAPTRDTAPAVQPTRQVELGADAPSVAGDELPFTGFAAIPVVVLGLGLIGGGLALRRRAG